MSVRQVIKRDGSIVDFDRKRIENAVYAAARAVGNGEGRPWAEMISWAVTGILKDQFGGRETPPHVEQIQDIVEQVLVKSGNPQVAKAYILYRQQRANARATEQMLLDTEKLVEDYLQRADWRVNENSNMNYSLQGLNFYLASSIAARYWLHTIYPPEVQEAHIEGDLHIHDLGMLSVYCCGWDLQDLLQEGFGGVPAKIESKPPRHLRTALGQLVNFFYTLQGESAGAVAVSNFDTLLAPFIRYDGLNYAQVKQAVQEFVFNINVPTRVGFQCLSEDTDILTPQGWKSYDDLQVGDTIKTFNLETGVIEDQPVLQLFARPYSGPMYRLRNRIQDQLISPGHRVVRKKFNAESMFVLEEIEQVATYKSPVIIPVSGLNENPPGDISDEEIRLVAWIIAEGTKESSNQHRHSNRITIYQSQEKSPDEYAEIIRLLEHLDLTYSVRDSTPALGQPVRMIRLNAESSHHLLDTLFGSRESVKFIPDRLKNLDQHQARLFLDTYLKADGHEGCEITTSDIEILNGLQHIAVDAGYGFTVSTRKPTLGRKPLHILRLIAHQDTYIQRIETVEFSGVIWCPTTENQTVIARRRGKVFITGNTPFTNVTMDLAPHPMLRDQPVIIGGETREETYGEFQAEMDLINRAFAEVMLEGDAKGRVFTFPIPTYNIGKDFDWENPDLEPIWRMAAKYGIPYFANFVNSDMQPEDARSMCPIAADEKVLIRSTRGRGLEYAEIRGIYEGNTKQEEYEIYSDGRFIRGRFNKFLDQRMLKVTLVNGHELKMTTEHLNYVRRTPDDYDPVEELKGEELKTGMYLPYSLNAYPGEGGTRDLGYLVGAYAGDGSLDGDSTVVFSLNRGNKELVEELRRIAEGYFGAHCTETTYEDTQLLTLKVHCRAAVGLCKDFVAGKKRNKHYSARLFGTSIEFREGVIAGHYATNGGNRHRIYTSSPKMIESLNMLAATLGTTTSIYRDERPDRLGKEPSYAVLTYQLNRANYGDTWYKRADKLWIKIKSIESIPNTVAYCFEVTDGEPVFTVGTTGILTHNCRLRLDQRELRKRMGGLFAAAPLTGSVGVVTMNLARLGYLAEDEEDFRQRLEQLMYVARISLEIKRKMLETFTERGLYPYSHHYLRGVKAQTGGYWNNHFSTIGLNGMHEASLNLLGVGIDQPEGRAFGVRTLQYMRDVLAHYQEETGHLYNLEATPAEGATYRLARNDKERYPDIRTAGSETAPYYTNSTHLPVAFSDDLFGVLDHQDDLQTLYTGGTVLHIFLGEQLDDWRQARNLVRAVAENYRLPYYTLTPTFSVCPVHGYIPGEHPFCPYEHTEEQLKQFGRRVVVDEQD